MPDLGRCEFCRHGRHVSPSQRRRTRWGFVAKSSCSLRAAVAAANADPFDDDVIELPAGTYTLSIDGRVEDMGLTGDLDLLGNVTLRGAGAATTIIDADQIDRALHVITADGQTARVEGVTVTGGLANDNEVNNSDDGAGVLAVGEGRAELADCAITGNEISELANSGDGAGVNASGSALAITRCSIHGNANLATNADGGGVSSNLGCPNH